MSRFSIILYLKSAFLNGGLLKNQQSFKISLYLPIQSYTNFLKILNKLLNFFFDPMNFWFVSSWNLKMLQMYFYTLKLPQTDLK